MNHNLATNCFSSNEETENSSKEEEEDREWNEDTKSLENKTTFNRRRPSMEDDLRWKTTY